MIRVLLLSLGFATLPAFLTAQTCTQSITCTKANRSHCESNRSDQQQSDRSGTKRLMLVLGGGPQYTLDQAGAAFPSGKGGGSLEPATPAQRLNWQATGFLGYRFNGERRGRAHAFGFFGSYGSLTPEAGTETLARQGLAEQLPAVGSSAFYREAEAGFLLRETLRLSAGIGEQLFTNDSGESFRQTYYSATVGLHLRLARNLLAYTNLGTQFGRDFREFSFRPSAGVALQLRTLRF